MPGQILLDFEYPEHHDVVLAAALDFFGYRHDDVERVLVQPMERLSTNRLCVYRIRVKPRQQPETRACFAKVASYNERRADLEEKLREEYKAWKLFVKNYLPSPSAELYDGDPDVPGVCLCYTAVGLHSSVDPRPLRDLWRRGLSEQVCSNVIDVLDSVHKLVERWRSRDHVVDEELALAEEYEEYLRWDRTEPFLRAWIGRDGRDKTATFMHELGLVCPWEQIEQCILDDTKWPSKRRPMHGDFHQRNILVEETGGATVPGLIDFEWTKKRHVLVDYVLLEASLKLFEFAGLFSEGEYLSMHDALDSNEPLDHLESHRPGVHVWKILQKIRALSQQEGLSDDEWHRQYYTASLFTTMGMLTKPSCSQRMGYLTCAWMASRM